MRPTLRASASAVQIGLEPICRAVAAFTQLELFRVYKEGGLDYCSPLEAETTRLRPSCLAW
ncbi:hypothetical protein F018LOC_02656 [Pectobacterium versatile]|nr:hypothetical protein F018LOC_02656 [Pectobacterium versatile]